MMLAVNVVPTVETASSGQADDIAIWIHPTDPSQSTVIGTHKTSSTSIRVYNLQGQSIQAVSVSNVNNIDLRYNFPLNGQRVALLSGSNRSNDSIVIYKIDPQTRQLTTVAARTISTGIAVYGCVMYVSPTTGKYYTFVISESGQVQQWELFDNGANKVDAKLERSFFVGSRSEGLVADDVLGHLYVGEENVAIWKYSAEPTGGSSRTRVDSIGSGGHLRADVEGLTLYYAANGMGYLLASSQGRSEFVVYRREGTNAFVGSFKLVAGGGIDSVTASDGIDVTNFALGPEFPQGMFVAQDNDNNFKFARWDAVDTAFGGSLTTDTNWDPRLIGLPPQPSLVGDFDRDDTVGASDYVLWRKTLGATGHTPYIGADGDGDGTIDKDDYGVWRAHFGEPTPAVGRGAAARALRQPASEDGLVLPAGAAATAKLINPIRNAALDAGLAMFGTRARPRVDVFQPRVWISNCGIDEPDFHNLLQLAIDHLRLPAREDLIVLDALG
jgi:3-phytase